MSLIALPHCYIGLATRERFRYPGTTAAISKLAQRLERSKAESTQGAKLERQPIVILLTYSQIPKSDQRQRQFAGHHKPFATSSSDNHELQQWRSPSTGSPASQHPLTSLSRINSRIIVRASPDFIGSILSDHCPPLH
jgi:hypothetical protein